MVGLDIDDRYREHKDCRPLGPTSLDPTEGNI